MDIVTAAKLLVLACASYLWFRYKNKLQIKSIYGSQQTAGITEKSLKRKVLYPGPDDFNKVKIDIVAVHGPGSNVDWTWIWKDRTKYVHWLRDPDMLPAALPNARIMVYSYESRWHTEAPEARLELCGGELMEDLHNFRTKTRDRPVIFIGHSLGGLVVLHCLLFANRIKRFKYLPARTVGFLALGTPFRGTKMQTLAKKAAWLMAPAGSHNGIITDLKQDNKHLADYGRNVMLPGVAKGMVVEEESAHLPGWGRTFLYTDHFGLNKFSGPNNRSFLSVTAKLQDIYANTENLLERRNTITRSRHFLVPFGRNENFVGRDSILEQLLERIPPSANRDDCQRTAVEGLGGIGKTQVALEATYRKAYREIGETLGVQGLDDDKADVKWLVKAALSHENACSWLLVLDNADDLELLFTVAALSDYLPFSRKGSILFTTRNHEAAVRLDIPQKSIVTIAEMSEVEARALLRTGLAENQIRDTNSTARLLEFLANLPLAIKQASAYMASNTNVTVAQYLSFCQSSHTDMIDLLGRQFEDRCRYKDVAKKQNPIATTWLISFEHISQHNPQAAAYLKSMCFLAEQDIPLFLLPQASKTRLISIDLYG
ncbi:hypothetical protein DL770_010783 [Monosporascus sp. CRB-9-2]|nr:hypothetical protein DL770_010783 [Monosporascus sp. CRB-9-2]